MLNVDTTPSGFNPADHHLVPPVAGDQLPRATQPPKVKRDPAEVKRRVRIGLIVVVVATVVYLVQNLLIGPLIFEQRQRHLAADMNKPVPTLRGGDALGLVQIPALGVNRVFVEGVSADNMRGAPAHLAGSALPGDAGVLVLFGHLSTYGSPFEKLAILTPGADIVMQARNGGPIVRYIVDRVERRRSLGDIVLDKTDVIAYALLVTSEDGLLSNSETIVVARALPVTEATPVAVDLTAGQDGGVPFGMEALLAFGSAAAAALAWMLLSRRMNVITSSLVVVPIALYAVIRVVMLVDNLLPLTR